WNARAPELWRYTTTYLYRALARAFDLPEAAIRRLVRVEYAKVAEYQTRGLIHFHAIIRLDAATPRGEPKRFDPPPPPFDRELLEYAVRAAAGNAQVPVPDPHTPGMTRLGRVGPQLDIPPITTTTTRSPD